MGRKKKTRTPAPPKIEEPPPIVQEIDLINRDAYMRQQEANRMSVESTILSSPIMPQQTMMSSASKKRKKPEVDQSQMMGY